jgi:hypothetical protein
MNELAAAIREGVTVALCKARSRAPNPEAIWGTLRLWRQALAAESRRHYEARPAP